MALKDTEAALALAQAEAADAHQGHARLAEQVSALKCELAVATAATAVQVEAAAAQDEATTALRLEHGHARPLAAGAVGDLGVRVASRSIPPRWGPIRFFPLAYTCALWGVRVGGRAKPLSKMPTLN